MDNRAEVREFLVSRRAKISPEQAGVPTHGQRRVPGLRRTEVASLAGVSVEYYAKLERGALAGVSATVLDAIARALQLDPAERAHLFPPRPGCRRHRDPSAPPTPRHRALDTTARTAVGPRRVHRRARDRHQRPSGPPRREPPRPRVLRRHLRRPDGAAQLRPVTFLDTAARRFFPDWDLAADMCVANLRTAAGRDPNDAALHDLVGELATRSPDFARRWGTHDVRTHGTGVKHFHHHVVGDLTLAYESLDLVAEPGLRITLYAAEPGSATAQALTLLAAWAATSPAVHDDVDVDSPTR